MAGKAWSEDRKRAQARRLRARWRDPAYRARQVAHNRHTTQQAHVRAAASARMKALNARMVIDEKLKAKCIRGITRARREPSARAIQALVQRELMSRPEMKALARAHLNPRIRKKQWRTRRRKMRAREHCEVCAEFLQQQHGAPA